MSAAGKYADTRTRRLRPKARPAEGRERHIYPGSLFFLPGWCGDVRRCGQARGCRCDEPPAPCQAISLSMSLFTPAGLNWPFPAHRTVGILNGVGLLAGGSDGQRWVTSLERPFFFFLFLREKKHWFHLPGPSGSYTALG